MSDTNTPKETKILVMKGGGVKGLAYVGALKELEKHYNFEWYVGTSAGAISAVLLAAGYNSSELEIELSKDFSTFKDANILGLNFFPINYLGMSWNIISKSGFHQAITFTDWIKELLSKKLDFPENLTVQLKDLKHRVTIYACRKDRDALIFDSAEAETQKKGAAYAVRCSMAIPLIFTPERSESLKVFDGGARNNYPIGILKATNKQIKKKDILGLYLGGEKFDSSRHSFLSRAFSNSILGNLLSIWTESVDEQNLRRYLKQTIIIDPFPISTLNFNLNPQEKDFLLNSGKLSALKYLIKNDKVQKIDTNFDELDRKVKEGRENLIKKYKHRKLLKVLIFLISIILFYFVFFCPWSPPTYATNLEQIEKELSFPKNSTIIKSSSYLDHIKKFNPNFNSFLQEFNDSLETNPKYRGIAYVTAPAGFGKSFFTKKWIEEEIPSTSIGKIKTREDIVCGEPKSKCYSSSLGFRTTESYDLTATSSTGEKINLGWVYDYNFDIDALLKHYNYSDSIDILILDDLDELSEETIQKYLKGFEKLIENNIHPSLNLVVFMSRPEALSSYLSNTYYEAPNVDRVFGIKNSLLNSPIFYTISQIKDRVENWADWYGPKRLGRSITIKERDLIHTTTCELFKKYHAINLQLQIQSNSDFLFRSILDQKIKKNSSELEIKSRLFNLMLGRNSDSHHRPAIDSDEGVIYQALLKKVVQEKINPNELKNGWFLVENNEPVEVSLNGKKYYTTVKSLLNRSGLITVTPIDSKYSEYRFEPFWIHRYLLELN